MAEITTAYGQKVGIRLEGDVRCIYLDTVDPRNGETTRLAEIGLQRWELEALLDSFDEEQNTTAATPSVQVGDTGTLTYAGTRVRYDVDENLQLRTSMTARSQERWESDGWTVTANTVEGDSCDVEPQ